ncbi:MULTISPECIES: autotransporter-associated beta strand repeat-containing protein, partial [unclassified Azospirillum]|uniref:autotransporter-associated beta strand repeat-containing protein n=1 Tax=unclassified Azospirillum TaxID=2630922 RepID=UPI000B6F0387
MTGKVRSGKSKTKTISQQEGTEIVVQATAEPPKKGRRRRQELSLEPRIMFDAAAVATAADALTLSAAQQVTEPQHDHAADAASALRDADSKAATAHNPVEPPPAAAPAAAAPAETAPAPTPVATAESISGSPASDRKEVAFIDTSVADWQTLRDGVKDGVEVVLLDGSKDGLAQMAAWAEGKSGYDAIHVLSHGSEGQVQLGTLTLNTTMAEARAGDLAQIGAALTETGDLLLYGCQVATGEGRALIDVLSHASGADVAASNDLTGAVGRGGDWSLEVASGQLETNSLAFSTYSGLLAERTVTFTPASGTVDDLGTDATDGEGGSTNVSDNITIFTGQPDGTAGGHTIYSAASDSSEAINKGGLTTYSGGNGGGAVGEDAWIIKSTNSANNFNLKSITIINGSGDFTQKYKIVAYNDGVQVGETAEIEQAGAPTYPEMTKVISQASTDLDPAIFGNIDEIRIVSTDSSQLYIGLNSIVLDDPAGSDSTAPTLDGANSTPIDNATNVAVGADIVVDFSENVQFGTSGTITLRNATQGQNAETFDVSTINSGTVTGSNGSTLTISGDKLTLNPSGNLLAGTQYSVRFDAGSIKDTAGNNLAAISDDTSYNFTTTAPTVSLSVNNATVAEAAGTSTITATLSAAASSDTVVTIGRKSTSTATLTDDFTLSSTSITILAGQTTGTATLTAVQDTLDEVDETAIIEITAVSGGGGATENGTAEATVTITDDDAAPTLSIADVTEAEGNGSTHYMTFTVTLSAASSKTVTVNWATADGTALSGEDYANDSGILTFAPGETSKTFDVLIGEDTDVESDETFSINLSGATNATIARATATGTLVNDDINANAPVISGLDGDVSETSGTTSTFIDNFSTLATVSDAQNDWNGAKLVVQRTGGALSTDEFSLSSAYFSAAAGTLTSSPGGVNFATYNTNGNVLTITFNSSATATLIGNVLNGIKYENAKPYGNTPLTITLTDAASNSTSVTTTVNNNTIYIDNATDTTTIDLTDGVSFSEAIAIAAADTTGEQYLMFASNLANQTISLAGNITISENLIFDATLTSGLTLTGSTITFGAGTTQVFYNETGNTLTIASALGGSGGFTKYGEGTLTLSGTQTGSGSMTVGGGTLSVASDANLLSGALTLDASDAVLAVTGATTIDNAITLGSNGATVNAGANVALSGLISGSGGLTKTGAGTLTLGNTGNEAGWSGNITLTEGTLSIAADDALSSGSLLFNGGRLNVTGTTTIDNAVSMGLTNMFNGNGTIDVDVGAALTLSASIISGGGGALEKVGAGTLVLGMTSANQNVAYRVTEGTLALTNPGSALGTFNSLTLNGGTLSLAGGTLGAEIAVDDNSTISVTGDATISGPISGSADLTTAGTAQLTLTGNNSSYGGEINVSAGTLSVASDSNLGSGAITLADGSTLAVTSDTTIDNAVSFTGNGTVSVGTGTRVTLSGNLSGTSGNLTKTGAGTLVLSGTNNTDGTGLSTITATAGTLQISSATNLGTDNVALSGGVIFATGGNTITLTNTFAIEGDGATFNQTGSGHLTLSNQVGGEGRLTKTGGGSLTLSANNDGLGGGVTISNGTLYAAFAQPEHETLGYGGLTLSGGTLVFSNAATFGQSVTFTGDATIETAADVTFSGTVSGTGGLTKTGAGKLTLSNTGNEAVWSGAITLTAGSLSIADDDALSSGTLKFNGGTLAATGNTTIDNAVWVGTTAMTNGNGTINVDTGITLTLSATGMGGGGGLLTKSGAGTLALGMITVNPAIEYDVTSGTLAATTGDIIVGTLTLSGGNLSLAGGTVAANIALSASATITTTGDATISGYFVGGGAASLTKAGTAQLTLSGDNIDLQGAITVSAGTLVAGHANALGSTTGTTTVSGGAKLGVSGGVTVAENIVLDTSNSTGQLLNIAGDNTLSGTIDHSSMGVVNVLAANGTTLTLSGIISGGGSGTGSSYDLHFGDGSNAGTVVLSGANTFKDAVFVQAGTLVLANNLALGDTSQGITEVNGGTVALQGGVTITGENIFDFFGGGISNLGGNNSFTGKIQKLFSTLNVDVATGSTLTVSGQIGDNEGIDVGAAGGLTKTGAGTLVLSGTNLYKGNTTVSAGTLSVSSDAALGASWTQNSNGTLDSNVGGAISLAAGTTLAVTGATTIDNAIAFNGAATITNSGAVTLSGVLSGTGDLTKAGTGTLTLSNTDNEAGWSGAITLSAGSLSIAADDALSQGTLKFDGGTLIATDTTTVDNDVMFIGLGTFNVATGVTLTLSATSLGGSHTVLTKTGAGTLALGMTSANPTVGYVVSSGTLALADGGMISSTLELSGGNLSLAGGTLTGDVFVNASATITTTGDATISGGFYGGAAYTLTKAGTAQLTLSASNLDLEGAITVSAGTLVAGHNNALGGGSGTTTVNSGASLKLADNVTVAEDITLRGTGVGNAGALIGGVSTRVNGEINLLGGTVNVGGAAGTNLTLANTIYSNGNNPFKKVGAGTVTLSGANELESTIDISAGTLVAASANALAGGDDGPGILALSGGTLSVTTDLTFGGSVDIAATGSTINVATGNTLTLSNDISSSNGFTKSGDGTLALTYTSDSFPGTITVAAGTLAARGNLDGGVVVDSGATLNVTGNLTLGGGLSGAGNVTLGSYTLTSSGSTDTTFSGIMSGTGGLTKTGSSTLTLSGQNSFTGAVTLSAGGLTLTNGGYLADGENAVSVASGATLTLDSGIALKSLTGTGSVVVTSNSSSVIGRNNSSDFTFGGALSGSGGLTKEGSGKLTLTGTNTSYSGRLMLFGGAVSIAGSSNIGTGDIWTMGTSTLEITGNATLANVFSLSAASTVSVGSGAAVTLSGAISGIGSLIKDGAGSLTLTGDNSYSGHTTVSAGSLVVGHANALGANISFLDGGTSVNTNAELLLANGITLAEDLTLAGGGVGVVQNGTATASGSITLTGNSQLLPFGSNSSLMLSGIISDGSASFGLMASGDGTVILSGNNTFDGNFTVSTGTVVVAHANALGSTSGTNTVQDGATLKINAGITLSEAVNITGTGVDDQGALVGGDGAEMAGNITLGAGGASVAATSGNTFTISGVISGTDNALSKFDAGTVILSGNNTYNDATIVEAGTLVVANASALGTTDGVTEVRNGATLRVADSVAIAESLVLVGTGVGNAGALVGGEGSSVSGTVTLNANSSIGVTTGSTFTISGLITDDSGSFRLTKVGAGTLELSNATNTFDGGLTISAGTVSAGAVGSLGTGTITLDGGTLSYTGSTATLTNAVTVTANHGTLSNSGNLTISGLLSGGGTLNKTGSGTLTLSNTGNEAAMSGGITVLAGTLTITNDDQLSAGTLTLNGGTLSSSGTHTIDNAIVLDDDNGTISLTDTLTLSGVISGTGMLAKVALGTLVLTGNNTYSGGTTIRRGTVQIAGANSLGTGTVTLEDGHADASTTLSTAASSAFTLTNNIVISDNTGDPTPSSISVDGTGTLTISGVISGAGTVQKLGTGTLVLNGSNTLTGDVMASAGTLQISDNLNLGFGGLVLNGGTLGVTSATTLTKDIAIAADSTINTAGTLTLSGVISGAGNLTKTGSSALTLSGNNTYTGTTTLSSGVIIALHSNALGTSAGGTTVANGTTLRLGNGITIADDLTLSGIGVNSGFGALKVNEGNASATVTGNITLAANTDIGAYVGTDTLTITGNISGNFALNKVGAGTVVLGGTNSYTTTTLSSGTLSVGADANLGSGQITLASGTTLLLTGTTATIDNAVSFTGAATISVATSGAATLSGGFSSTNSAVTKAGAGTLTLNTSGASLGSSLAVNAGTLLINDNSFGVTAGTTVASGATLGGNNTISGILTVNSGGTLSPGNSPGIITASNAVTLSSGSTFAVEIAGAGTTAGTDYDQLQASGSVDITGATLSLSITGTPTANTTYRIIDKASSGTITGTFAGLAEGDTFTSGGGTFTITYAGGDGNDVEIQYLGSVPTLTNLDGDTVALDSANPVRLDSGTALVATDATLDALNNGEGNWSGVTLSVQRFTNGVVDATANDVFAFDTVGADFVLDGTTLRTTGGQAFATISNSGGVLTVTFNSAQTPATTALVQQVAQRITYSNATPYGDVTLRVTSSNGSLSSTADVTVTSDLIYVDRTSDDADGDAADGFSLREALALGVTRTGADTIKVLLADNQTITLGSGVTAGAGDTLDLDGANGLTIAGSTLTLGGTLSISNGTSDTATISSVIAGGNKGLTKTGDGTLILSGNNTRTGATTISAGTLTVSGGSAIANTSAVSVSADATLAISNDVTIGTLTGAGNVTLGSSTLTVDTTAASGTFSGIISGAGALVKSGANIFTLSGANTYTGATTVSSGTLAVANNSALGGTNTSTTITGGASLTVADGITLAENLSVSGNGVGSGGSIIGNGTATISGTVTLEASSRFNVASGGNLTISGVISGDYTLYKGSAGTLTLTGDNNAWSGDFSTAAGGGTVIVGHNNALGDTTGTTTILNNTALALADGVTVAENITIRGTGISSTGALRVDSGSATLSGTVTMSGASRIDVGTGASLTLSGAIGGDYSLTKAGNGTLTLGGVSTYTGSTSVTGGTLLVTGSLGNTSAVSLQTGTTLGGTGSIFAANSTNQVTIGSNATLAPGVAGTDNGVGTLTINGNLQIQNQATLAVDIAGATAGTGYDQVVVNGTVDVTGGLISATHSYAAGSLAQYVIISNDDATPTIDAITGTFTGIAEAGTITASGNGTVLTASYTGPGGTGNNFTLTAPFKNAPVITNLSGDSVAWAGVAGTIGLDASNNLTVSDVENDLAGNWNAATLTVQRKDNALASDLFGFSLDGSGITIDGTDLIANSQTIGSYTNSNGVLTINFNANATTALVQEVTRGITYRNDTPTGDTIIRFSLSDGSGESTTADVTVTSDTIYVTNTTDTSTIDVTDGISFSEAVAIAAADSTGTQTLVLAGSFANTTLTLAGNLALDESLIVDTDAASGATIAGSTLTIGSGYTLTVTNSTSDTATISSVIAGSGNLTKTGAGTLTLSGTNTLTGALSITGGTLAVGGSSISTTSGLTLDGGTLAGTTDIGYSKTISLGSSGGTIDMSSGGATLSGVISGDGKLTVSSTNASKVLTLSGTNTHTGGTTLNNGIFQFNTDSAAGTGTLTINGGKIRAGLAARTLTNAVVLGGNMTLAGSYALTLSGAVDLGGADRTIDNGLNVDLTFSGAISNGSLTIGGTSGTGAVILSGTNTYTNTTISGGNTSTNSNILSVASADNLGTGTITVNGAGAVLKITSASTFAKDIAIGSSGGRLDTSAAVTLSGIVSGTGALTKAGAGTLTLSGTNTHSGAVTVSAGTLALSGGSSIADSSAVTVDSGATLSLTGGAETIGSLSGAGSVSLSYGLTVGGANTSTTFSGVISSTNTSGITKVGTGTLTLTGTNTYTGSTSVSAGGLTLNAGEGALADTSAVTVAADATLTVTANDTIGSLAGAGTVALGGSLLTFGGDDTSTTFSGTITGATGGSIKKLGTGTFTLSGTNSYVGGTDLAAGTIVAGTVGALGSGGISFSAGTTLDLAASGTFANYIDLAANATITVGTGIGATLSNTVDGSGNLTKTGAGTLTLSGTNSYTGTTTVSAGTLNVTEALNGSGAVGVDSGATLAGTGSITGAVTVNSGGTLAPGLADTNNGVGTLTLNGGLTIASGGTLAVDIAGATAGTGYDQVVVNGTVDVTNAVISATLSYTPTFDAKFHLISNDGSDPIVGTFTSLAEGDRLTPTGNSGVEFTAHYAATDAGETTGGNEFMLSVFEAAPSLGIDAGALTYAGVLKDGVAGVDGLDGATTVTVSADGKNVYVTGQIDKSLVVFNRDTTTGVLTYSTVFKDGINSVDGLDGAQSVVVSADGKNVYVASSTDKSLAVFNRDTSTGALTYSTVLKDGINNVDGLDGAQSVTISADGKNVYVAGFNDSAVAVFTRDTSTGALTYASVLQNNVNNVAGLSGAYSVTVSPDDKHVYVASYFFDGIAVFSRDASTGALTFATTIKNGLNNVIGLDGAQSITVSPDGKNVYVASSVSSALAVFSRDSNTGALTYVTALVDGQNGVDGLNEARSVTMSADGLSVYVAGSRDNALAAFTRNPSTGALTFAGMITNGGSSSVDGLIGANSVAVSADGKNVYVASFFNDALVSFNRETASNVRTVTLADAANGLANPGGSLVTDIEGNWSGGTLTIERVTSGGAADGNANDLFSFLSGLSVTGGSITKGADSSGTISDGTTVFATWAYTSASGRLVVTFDSAATTAQVQTLVRNIGYSNDTPYGDATIRLTLTDRVATNTAIGTVTVTSNTIYVDDNSDDSDGDAVDGFSLREALARGAAQSGADTIKVVLTGNTTITLGSAATAGSGDTLDLDGASGLTIDGSTITLAGTLTVTNSTSDTATISSVIIGSGNLTKAGAGTLTLSATNSYSGTTSVTGGTLSVSSDGNLGAGGLTLGTGATLSITGTSTIDNAIALSGAATISNSAAVTLSGALSGGAQTLTKSGSGTLTLSNTSNRTGLTGGATVLGGALAVSAGNALMAGTITLDGGGLTTLTTATISNDIALESNGGTLTNTTGGTGTFSGIISGSGALKVTGASTLALSGNNTFTGGTTLDITNGWVAVGSNTAFGTGSVTVTNGALSFSNDQTLTNNFILDKSSTTIDVSSTKTVTLSGVISETASTHALNLTGSGGTLTLSGSNTFTGNTYIGSGATLRLSGGSAITDTTEISNGGTLVLDGDETIGGLWSGGGTNLNGHTLTINNAVNDYTYSGAISGSGALVKAGDARLTLSGTNSGASATITVQGGTLSVADDAKLTGGDVTLDGGTLLVSSAATIDNNIILSSASTITNDYAVTLSGIISGSGDLTKDGGDTLTLSGANTYTGTTTLRDGILSVAGDDNLGTGTLTLNGGTLTVTGTSVTIDNAITLGLNHGTVSNANSITLSGIISGDGDLTKTGTGALTLSGANTGTGTMTVSAGSLSVGGDDNLLGGSLTLNGGTLTVTGSSVTIDNAISLGLNHGTVSNANALTLSGVISGSGNFTKSGLGTLTLSGTNSYTGTSSFAGGTVNVSADSNLG